MLVLHVVVILAKSLGMFVTGKHSFHMATQLFDRLILCCRGGNFMQLGRHILKNSDSSFSFLKVYISRQIFAEFSIARN